MGARRHTAVHTTRESPQSLTLCGRSKNLKLLGFETHLEKSELECGIDISYRNAPRDTNQVLEKRKPLAEKLPGQKV